MFKKLRKKNAADLPQKSPISSPKADMRFALELNSLVKKIEINVSRKIGMLSPGGFKSAWKGKGLNFSEVREYTYGDDIKDIDWNVTARMGHPYIKIFSEERESNIIIIADNSMSMDFGLPGRPKKHLLWEITALLGLLAMRNNDKIGMFIFGGQKNTFFPARKGKKAFHALLRHLVSEPSVPANFQKHKSGNFVQGTQEEALYFLRAQKKRSIVFFVSDFLFPLSVQKWRWLTKQHETIWFHVVDPMEEGMKSHVSMELIDMETGQNSVLHGWDQESPLKYEILDFFQEQYHRGAYLKITTLDAFDKKIVSFFQKRKKHAAQ